MHGVILALFVPSDVLFENSALLSEFCLPLKSGQHLDLLGAMGFSFTLAILWKLWQTSLQTILIAHLSKITSETSDNLAKFLSPYLCCGSWFIPLWLQVFNTIVTSLFSWSRWSGFVFEGLEEVWEIALMDKIPFRRKIDKKSVAQFFVLSFFKGIDFMAKQEKSEKIWSHFEIRILAKNFSDSPTRVFWTLIPHYVLSWRCNNHPWPP